MSHYRVARICAWLLCLGLFGCGARLDSETQLTDAALPEASADAQEGFVQSPHQSGIFALDAGAPDAMSPQDAGQENCDGHRGLILVEPGESIQAAMDEAQAYAKCKSPTWPNHELKYALQGRVVLLPGTHSVKRTLFTRAHVSLEAAGATLVNESGSHFMGVDDNGGGGYNAPAYWRVSGGLWDANDSRGFSIVHTLAFEIRDLEIKDVKRVAHHLEINSSGGQYEKGVYNVVVDNVTMHGVAKVHRVDDEAINIDYSWKGAARNVAGDGTVANNVLIQNCTFYDVPRAIATHHFQLEGGAPDHKMRGITIRDNHFRDMDPSRSEATRNFEWSGAVRVYGWENVRIVRNRFSNVATAISLFTPSDYPTARGHMRNIFILDNEFEACGRLRRTGQTLPIVHGWSNVPAIKFVNVKVVGNKVIGDWVAASNYVVSLFDTHDTKITENHFAPTAYSLSREKSHNKYKARGESNTGSFELDDNTVSDGSEDNS